MWRCGASTLQSVGLEFWQRPRYVSGGEGCGVDGEVLVCGGGVVWWFSVVVVEGVEVWGHTLHSLGSGSLKRATQVSSPEWGVRLL